MAWIGLKRCRVREVDQTVLAGQVVPWDQADQWGLEGLEDLEDLEDPGDLEDLEVPGDQEDLAIGVQVWK